MPSTETGPSKRRRDQERKGLEREMSLSDLPMETREDLGLDLKNLFYWSSRNIAGAIQRLGGTEVEEGVAQIINEVLAHRSKEIATLSARGENMNRMGGDVVDECDGMSYQTRWFNFRKASWGIHT